MHNKYRVFYEEKRLAIKLSKDTVVSIFFGTFPLLIALADIYAELWVMQVCCVLISASIVRGVSGYRSDRALFEDCNALYPRKIAVALHLHDLVLVVMLAGFAFLVLYL